MKINTIFTLILLLLSASFLIAESKDDNVPKYDINLNYKQGVYNVYRFTERTEVDRVYDDSSGNKYTKTYTYYVTIFAPDTKQPNDFFTVDVTIDSLDYKFESGNKEVEHFSQNTEKPLPIGFHDYLYTVMPLNTEFELTYSPYGDVAKVESDFVSEKRKSIGKMKDEEKKEWMLHRLSDETLKFLTDIPKGIYPTFKVIQDTSWTSEINLNLGDISFRDEVDTKFLGYKNREYHLVTVFDSLDVSPGNYQLTDIEKKAEIDSGIASGTITTDLYTSGEVNYMRAEIVALVKGRIKRLGFTQNIKTTLTWDLLDRYKF